MIVLDAKDYDGLVTYDSKVARSPRPTRAKGALRDLRRTIRFAHEMGDSGGHAHQLLRRRTRGEGQAEPDAFFEVGARYPSAGSIRPMKRPSSTSSI